MKNELYHYGMPKRSGRYPYGSGDRPYQDSEVPKKKKRIFGRKKEEQQAKEKVKQLSKNEKENLLREGTASDVLKYKNQLSNDELVRALNRIKTTESLKTYSRIQADEVWRRVDSVINKVGKVTSWAQTGVNAKRTMDTVMGYLNSSSQPQNRRR